ncbi:hypothetical protein [Aquisalimonas sp.]|uniref:hypothetical protein n=1 Tax=Aquisalimonas sp. TaxID=1872621 RepID=UPI0025C6B58B|nr:hypothetical protein [Aquisalimonas sp.]
MRAYRRRATAALIAAGVLGLGGCFGSGNSSRGGDVETRPHDQREFVINTERSDPLEELPGLPTQRWTGELNGAAYHVEVPERDWNEILVMYAHGFRGDDKDLYVSNPRIREFLIEQGFAWAASSFSTNFYDVRAGVEDTNALALAFQEIAAENGRDDLPAPSRQYIMGISMGGHVTAAAIEQETRQTANNVVDYQGAAPFCGVMGDTELFNYFLAYHLAAMELAEVGTRFPVPEQDAPDIVAAIRDHLWEDYPEEVNARGQELKDVLMHLSGGERPGYAAAFAGWQDLLQGFIADDGTIDGILNANVLDTSGITYRGADGTPTDFNDDILTVRPDDGANARRADGLRWIPRVLGQFSVPVVSTHTTGDLFVPFSMQQIYARRANENGNDSRLVQRAVRTTGHCDFTVQEKVESFMAMHEWVETADKPTGDNILDPGIVSDPDFGCEFTTADRLDQGIGPCPTE